VQAWVAKRLG